MSEYHSLVQTTMNGVGIFAMPHSKQSKGKTFEDSFRRTTEAKKDLTKRERRMEQKAKKDSLQLIQDMAMPISPENITQSPDGKYFIMTGAYPPQFHCYDAQELSMKFKRHVDEPILKSLILSSDYRKLVFLQSQRWIELHNQAGTHYRLRVPKEGRDITYHEQSCDLLVAASGPNCFRINLEVGTHMLPIETDAEGQNCVKVNPVHGLIGLGCENSVVECWDSRDLTRAAGKLDVGMSLANHHGYDEDEIGAITALQFDSDGLTMAAGTENGVVAVYDLRMNKPTCIRDHNYDLAIRQIEFFRPPGESTAAGIASNNIISVCKRTIKIWDRDTGKMFTAVEPEYPINQICVVKTDTDILPPFDYTSSGLILAALETNVIHPFFIPKLGAAPSWCSWLQKLSTDVTIKNENRDILFDSSKFVTQQELEELGLHTRLEGNASIKPYLHGYLVDANLYRKTRKLMAPQEFEAWVDKNKKEKKGEEKAERISFTKKRGLLLNEGFAQDLVELTARNKAKAEGKDPKSKLADDPNLQLSAEDIIDPRFRRVFRDKRFEIDEYSQEYIKNHPSKLEDPAFREKYNLAKKARKRLDIADQFEPILGEEKDKANPFDSDEDMDIFKDDADSGSDDEAATAPVGEKENVKTGKKMFQIQEGHDVHASAKERGLAIRQARESNLPLGERLRLTTGRKQREAERVAREQNSEITIDGDTRSMSFIPADTSKRFKRENPKPDDSRKRRNVKDLNLSKGPKRYKRK